MFKIQTAVDNKSTQQDLAWRALRTAQTAKLNHIHAQAEWGQQDRTHSSGPRCLLSFASLKLSCLARQETAATLLPHVVNGVSKYGGVSQVNNLESNPTAPAAAAFVKQSFVLPKERPRSASGGRSNRSGPRRNVFCTGCFSGFQASRPGHSSRCRPRHRTSCRPVRGSHVRAQCREESCCGRDAGTAWVFCAHKKPCCPRQRLPCCRVDSGSSVQTQPSCFSLVINLPQRTWSKLSWAGRAGALPTEQY